MAENFIIDLIASLKKSQTKKQIKEDVKNLGDIKVPLIGTLKKSQTKKQIKEDLSSINGTVNLSGKVNNKKITESVHQATEQAQRKVNDKPIEINFSVKKNKLVNDIKLLGQQNSKLFKDTSMSKKYTQLLDSAQLANSTKELNNIRLQLGAFRSELKVTGNTGMTMADTLKSGFSKVLQFFGGYSLIMRFTAQLKNAWREAEELDSAMTDLSRVNAEISRGNFPDYLDKVISRTKELAVATKDYIDAMTTFSRAGYNLADSEALADMAVQLEHVGDMGAEDASKALLAGLQGYDKIDGYGMDQLAEKAQALNDKIDLIGNTASISQEEVARGIQAVGSVMSDANTSVDEFIAMLGAGNRAVQDSNKVALAIRTSALRIRGCTVELQEMGEETDDVIESTSTLAAKIKALTNIDGSGGVNILEADEETFRSIYDIYNDISKVYSKMSDTDASALLELIAGKHRSNQVSSILGNMAEANELLNSSLNAAGTASNEYQIYLDGAKASTERFGVAMTETYNNVINGETVKGLTNAGTAVLDFANSCGILEGTLKGFLALGILKGIITLSVAFKNSAVQAGNFGTALSTVKDMSLMVRGTTDYTIALKTLKSVSLGLSETQLKQVLASETLSESERIAILRTTGLTKAQAQAKLAQMGLTQSTNAQTTANASATASTFSLTAAVKGFGASVKTAFLSNPIGMIMLGISTAIGVFSSAISKSNQKVEEARQKAKEAADAYKESSSSMDDYISRYSELREQLIAAKGNEEETYNVKKQLLDLQTDLNQKYGEEHGYLSLVTDAYKDQTEAIKELNKEEAKRFLNENEHGITAAKRKMESEKTYDLSYAIAKTPDNEKFMEGIVRKYEKDGMSILDAGESFYINLDADPEDAYETINSFMTDVHEKAKELGNENLFKNTVSNAASDSLNEAKETLDKYQEIYKQSQIAQIASDDNLSEGYDKAVSAVEAYNEAVLKSENPYEDGNVNKAWNNLQTVKKGIQENEEEWGKYSGVMDDVFSAANDNVYSFYQSLKNDADVKKLAEDIKGLSDVDLQAMHDDGDNGDAFDKLAASAQEYGLEAQDLIDLLVRLGYAQGEISKEAQDAAKSLSFQEAFDSLDTTEDDSLKSLKDDLLSLAEAGQLTLEKFTNTTGSSDFLMMLGIEENDTQKIDNLISQINQLKSSADQLSSMKKGISGLSGNLYNRGQNPGDAIDADTLSGMDSVLKEQTAEWEKYVTVLGDASSSMDDVQKATDELATAYVNSNNFLANLTDANKDYYVSQLDAMGVANSAEVVESRLTAQRQAAEYKAQALSIATKDLADSQASHTQRSVDSVNATYKNSAAFAEQSGMTNLAKAELADLIAKERIFAETGLDTSAKVAELNKLALAYFGVANAIQTSSAMGGDSRYWNSQDEYNNAIQGDWDAFLKKQKHPYSVGVDIKPQLSKDSGGSGGSSDTGSNNSSQETKKDFSETFDWIERRIKKFQRAFDKWLKQAETAVTSGFINKYYKKAFSSAKSQLSIYGKAYNRYMAEANAVDLDEKYAKKVRNGTIDLEEIHAHGTEEEVKKYEELAEKIKKYQDYYDKAQDSMNSFAETAEKLYNLPLDKAAKKVDLFSNNIDLLGKKLDNAVKLKTKNDFIDKQTKEEKKTLNAYTTARNDSRKQLNSAKKELRKKKNLNDDDGITKKERAKIKAAAKKNKEVNLAFFTENSAGYKAAIRYNEALKANKKAISDAATAQQDYNRWLVEASKLKFDNIADFYNKKVQLLGYSMSDLATKIKLVAKN